jgi:DNA processing protein
VPLSSSALEPLLRLAVVPGIGPGRLQQLIREYGSAERALAAKPAQIERLPGFGPEMARRLRDAAGPRGRERARAALELLDRHAAVALTPDDRDYPASFRLVPDPPFLVFAVGDLGLMRAPAVAIVGTRRPSPYGRATAAALAQGLVGAGYVVVSGMASGIDAVAHGAALKAQGGTVGVLGHGIERVYPAENRALFRGVAEEGLLISEFAPGEEPKAGNFPRRNRLIAALAQGVIVVEMGVRSGAQHTVDAALELGREVFAVPGPIGSEASAGTNQLIKQGAALITAVADVIEALQGVGAAEPAPPASTARRASGAPAPAASTQLDAMPPEIGALAPDAPALFAQLGSTPRHVDELAVATGLPTSTVLALLLELELRGLIVSHAGKLFSRR